MRTLIRALPLALAAAFLALFALACKSGDGGDQAYNADDKTSGDLVSADPVDVLAASGESFEEDVNSLQAELQVNINVSGFKVSADSAMEFQAPDKMHATMDLTGLGTFEMLLLGKELYMNVPGQGWIQVSLEGAGLSAAASSAARASWLSSSPSLTSRRSMRTTRTATFLSN